MVLFLLDEFKVHTQDGVLLARVFQGSTDATVFEKFIEQLLPLCGKWPEPKSVLVMDNASFHHTERIEQMCYDAGVKLAYLPPYSPDFNPIEEFFAELKAFIKRNWQNYEENPEQGFDAFLRVIFNILGGMAVICRFNIVSLHCIPLQFSLRGDRTKSLRGIVKMIGTSTIECIILRACILFLHNIAPTSFLYSALFLVSFLLDQNPHAYRLPFLVEVWLLSEAAFYNVVFLPYESYL
jgi:hypothetical protein